MAPMSQFTPNDASGGRPSGSPGDPATPGAPGFADNPGGRPGPGSGAGDAGFFFTSWAVPQTGGGARPSTGIASDGMLGAPGSGPRAQVPGTPPPTPSPRSAYIKEFPPETVARLAESRVRARAWLEQLDLDPQALWRVGISGRKKLAEALDAYGALLAVSSGAEQASVKADISKLAEYTKSDWFHDLNSMGQKDFQADSLSYLRIATLLKEAGLDVSDYVTRIGASRARLDADAQGRGWWQRVAQARYYEILGLEGVNWGVMDAMDRWALKRREAPRPGSDPRQIYNFCHEIFIAYDYGSQMDSLMLDPEDRIYAAHALMAYLDWCLKVNFPDLAAECVSSLAYVGAAGDPFTIKGIDYLLNAQNADGSWGDYKKIEARTANPKVHFYLHSVIVALRAFTDVQRRL